jgi:Fe2+ transport system protein FeoA
MSFLINLSSIRPHDGPVTVRGFSENSVLKDHLLSFGIVPGVSVEVVGLVPGSSSMILQFGTWQGVLREAEAAIIQVDSQKQGTP